MTIVSEAGDGTDEVVDCYQIVLKGTIVPPVSLSLQEWADLQADLKEFDAVRQRGVLEARRHYGG